VFLKDQHTYVSCFLILVGALVMVLSILKFKQLFPVIKSLHTKNSEHIMTLFKVHTMLMVFFLIGYVIVGIALYFNISIVSDIFIGLIFMFGAFFVFLGIRIQYIMNNEQKKAETEITKAHESLLQSAKMAAVGRLAGGLAHEINNPLTAILGYSQLMLKQMQKENVHYKHLEEVEKGAIRCKVLVDEMLQFSRIQKTVLSKVDLNKTVEEITQIIKLKSKVSNVSLLTELDLTVLYVLGNKNQLQQVIMNLCNNAIDSVSSGGTVWVRTKHFKEYALLEVEDNGTGIPEDIRTHIFEPFFTTKEEGKGTGLGLSITFEILQKYGFEITLESEEKKGTKFTIKMPYNNQDNDIL